MRSMMVSAWMVFASSTAVGCSSGGAADEQVGEAASAHHAAAPKVRIKAVHAKGDPFLHRSGHQVVAVRDKLFVSRGLEDDIATQTNTFRNDVFRLDPHPNGDATLKALHERGDERLGETAYHCMVGDSRHAGSLLSFGGAHFVYQGSPDFFRSLTVSDTLWRYRVSDGRWTAIQPSGPKPAARAGCNAEFYRGSMYMFGGLNRFLRLNNELWRFDTETETWTHLTPSGPVPPPRFIGATVVDEDEGKIYLYNGHKATPSGFQTIGDFWVYDVQNNSFRQLPSDPNPPRDEGTLSILRAPSGKKYLVYTGGHTASPALCVGFTEMTTATNEVWAFDPDAESWQKLEVVGDAPRLEFVRGATIDNKHYLVGGWFDVPDPTNICRQVWNEDIYEVSLLD